MIAKKVSCITIKRCDMQPWLAHVESLKANIGGAGTIFIAGSNRRLGKLKSSIFGLGWFAVTVAVGSKLDALRFQVCGVCESLPTVWISSFTFSPTPNEHLR